MSASLKILVDAGATVDNSALLLAGTGGAVNYGGTRIINMLLADGTERENQLRSGLRAAAEVRRRRDEDIMRSADMLEAAAAAQES